MRIYNVKPAVAGLQSVLYYKFEEKNVLMSKIIAVKCPLSGGNLW
jgi:hypothetical protein